MPLFENMNMKSNSKVKKKLLIAAVAVLAIVVAVILVCAAYLHAGRSSSEDKDPGMLKCCMKVTATCMMKTTLIYCVSVWMPEERLTPWDRGCPDTCHTQCQGQDDKMPEYQQGYSGTCQGIWCCGQIYHDPESSGSTGIFIWQ